MLTSMTGYGAGTASDNQYSARVEVRSVNHRYLDVVLHLPHQYGMFEDKIRTLVSERISRGRVEIFATLEEFSAGRRTVNLDKSLLTGYAKALNEASTIIGTITVSMEALLAIPGLFQETEIDNGTDESVWPVLGAALSDALDKLVDMRQTEGARLQEDMLARLLTIETWLQDIEERVPTVVDEYRIRLQDRIAELLDTVPVSEDRLATEVALFADRSCITEELVRAASHICHYREACDGGGSVGRKLDFLLQELNREVNTIASKASDSLIAQHVVGIKAELEKVREQVQNIE